MRLIELKNGRVNITFVRDCTYFNYQMIFIIFTYFLCIILKYIYVGTYVFCKNVISSKIATKNNDSSNFIFDLIFCFDTTFKLFYNQVS